MLSSVNRTFDIFRLIVLIVFIIFVGYLVYYNYETRDLDGIEDINGLSPNVLLIITLVILFVLVFCSILTAARIFISPRKRREYLDKITYTTRYVMDNDKKKAIKEPTFLGYLLDYPFDKIKVADEKGNIINVTRIYDDLYQGDDGNLYNCLLGECELKKKNKINFIDSGIQIIDDAKH